MFSSCFTNPKKPLLDEGDDLLSKAIKKRKAEGKDTTLLKVVGVLKYALENSVVY